MAFDIWRFVFISFGNEAQIFGWIPNAVDLTSKQIKFNSGSQKDYLVCMPLLSTTVTLTGENRKINFRCKEEMQHVY